MSRESSITRHISTLILGADREFAAGEFMRRAAILAVATMLAAWIALEGMLVLQLRLATAAAIFVGMLFAIYLYLFIESRKRISQLEEALPEFLSIMASHIRSGQPYDRALLLSARKELGPLALEMDRVAKETISGTPLGEALSALARRVPSPAFSRTINLVVKGINSGGKLADLLEATALDMRRFGSIKKEVSATVLVYQLFSFAAVCIGAPMLYAITIFLVRIFAEARARIGFGQFSEPPSYLPFFQGAAISPELTFAFSVSALFITCLFGAFAAGVIAKGKESEGLPYLPAILVVSFAVFFLVGFALQAFLSGYFFS